MPGSPRHLDQATSALIHQEVAEELDELLARLVERNRAEPIDAVLREMNGELRRWAARSDVALPEHGGPGEQLHEELIDEPTSPGTRRPSKANGVNGNGVHG